MAPRNDDHDAYDETYVEDSYDSPADDDSYVDSSADDGEWTGEDDSEGTQEESAPPKKKKSHTLTIILVVVVAVIGVLGFMVMRGGSQPPAGEMAPVSDAQIAEPAPAGQSATDQQPTPEQAPIAANDQAATPPQQDLMGGNPAPAMPGTAPQQQAEAPQGLMANPDLVYQGTLPATENQPMQAPAALPDAAAQPPEGLAGAVSAVTPNVQPVSDFPTVDSIKKTETPNEVAPVTAPVTAPAPDLAVPTAAAPEVTPSSDPTKAQLDQANTRIQDLEKALADKGAELEKQRAEQTSRVDAEVNSLKTKIAELEEKLSASAKMPAAQPVEKEPAVHEEAAPKPAIIRTQSSEPKVSISSKPVVKAKASWVLKSAKPGFATISDKSTGDYKMIAVGDNVPGIGKVTAIGESPSGWVIQGTTGKITE